MTGAVARYMASAPRSGLKDREPRRQVFFRARMRADGALSDVCIRNISSRGMLLQAAVPPPRGSYVEIFCPRHTIVARVVWVQDRRFGVHTRERMDIGAVLGEGGSVDRRSPNRTAPNLGRRSTDVQQRFERSRQLSAAFEFGSLIAGSTALAMFAAISLYNYLTAAFDKVTTHL